MADLVVSPFEEDGPLADPWTATLELGYGFGSIPVAAGGIVTGEDAAWSHSIQRLDLPGGNMVGLQLDADWMAEPGDRVVILSLSTDDGQDWVQVGFENSGNLSAQRVTNGGASEEDFQSIFGTAILALPAGAAIALRYLDGEVSAMVSPLGDLDLLFNIASGLPDLPLDDSELVPGFAIFGTVTVRDFFSGIGDPDPPDPPEPGDDHPLLLVVQALAAALEPLKTTIPDLQIYPFLNYNPTPPSIDIFPADLFQSPLGFGIDSEYFFTVRARTTTADHEAGQRLLLRLLDRNSEESVEGALIEDQTLGGVVQAVAVAEDGISGYREYLEDPQANGRLIGCEWRVEVIA